MSTGRNDIHLECESVLAKGNGEIHEGQVSLTHGFVPHLPLAESLPPEYAAWDDLAANFPLYVNSAIEREKIAQIPVLDGDYITKLADCELLPIVNGHYYRA